MIRSSDETDNRRNSREQILRCMISCFSGVFTQLALLIIPHYSPLLSLLSHFLLSVVVLAIAIGICQYVRRLLGIHASAPAFVFFHIIFVWLVYITVIRYAVSNVLSIVLSVELTILLVGFFRILASDPGFVRQDSLSLVEGSISEDGHHLKELSSTEPSIIQNSSEEKSLSSQRFRYCRSCKAYVMGFDHHCPAFGNCIGEKNYSLFMTLLIGFILTEALYAMLSYQWINSDLMILEVSSSKIQYSLVMSTMNFSLLQVLWQVIFLAWHVYCVCLNIRTEEWINWRKYPEFHVIAQPSPLDQSFPDIKFRNPYNKGVFRNLKEFLDYCLTNYAPEEGDVLGILFWNLDLMIMLEISGSLKRRRNFPLLLSRRCHLSFFSSCSLLRSPLICRILPSSTSTFTSSFFSPGRSTLKTCASGVSFQSTLVAANCDVSRAELGTLASVEEKMLSNGSQRSRESGSNTLVFRPPKKLGMSDIFEG